MNFLSLPFMILMVILILFVSLIKNKSLVKLAFIAASYYFYSGFGLTALIILILMSYFTYMSGRIIAREKRKKFGIEKQLLIATVTLQLLVLIFFKYFGILTMPVGMSFYMLQAISYLVDMYRGDIDENTELLDVLLFIAFFPQILSGPIMKAKEFLPQIKEHKGLRKEEDPKGGIDFERLSFGIQLFALGAFEKLVIADRLSVSVDSVYLAPKAYSGLSLLFASLGYTLQLFFDFAAYSNMAVGVGKLLGFDLTVNFNLPYLALNPSDFWRRWHISLSSWLKEYVYIPLGGSRKGKIRTYVNLILTMIVSGMWHGSTINFFVWGALHGIASAINRFFGELRKEGRFDLHLPDIVSRILTFLLVSFLWIPFRAKDLKDTLIIFSRIFTLKAGINYFYVYTWIFAALLLLIQALALIKNKGNNPIRVLPLNKFYGKLILALLIIASFMFAYFGNGAFIYSQF
ncbi:MAG: hypothetical protein K5931_06800 [Lachnospiraceae bacterium]|nr:hypothetical protein [Lachnospiraceae bacterium]